jgi:hypothetical protein
LSEIELCFALFWRNDKTYILILILIVSVYVFLLFLLLLFMSDFLYVFVVVVIICPNLRERVNLNSDFLYFGGM